MFNNKNKSSLLNRLALGAMLLGMSMSSHAGLIGLDLENSPDLYSEFIQVNYDATSDEFSAIGTASQLVNVAGQPGLAIMGGEFDLSAMISDMGMMTNGSLTITGTIASLGFNSNNLLMGNLTQIGFDENAGMTNDDQLEFLFTVTGGDAAALFGGLGGVILDSTNFSGSWMADFMSGQFAGLSDTGVPVRGVAVPEPTSMWLLGSGLIGLAGFARRKQNK